MNKKKLSLMKAGMFCFSINGVEATRVEDITKRAGVAKGTFYTHFSSKEELLGQIMFAKIDEYAGLFDALRSSDVDFKDKVIRYLRARFKGFTEDPQMFYMMIALRRKGEMMLLKSLCQKMGRRGEKFLREFFEENIEMIKEEYRGELDMIMPCIMASLFLYQDIIAERIGIEIKEEKDYEKVTEALRRIDMEKYVEQIYNLNIKEMVRED